MHGMTVGSGPAIDFDEAASRSTAFHPVLPLLRQSVLAHSVVAAAALQSFGRYPDLRCQPLDLDSERVRWCIGPW